jgi:hypothetical protein
MSDIADWCNDVMQEANPSWFPYHVTRSYSGSTRRQPCCRYCKSSAVHWKETANGWRLANPGGGLHSCNEYYAVRNQQANHSTKPEVLDPPAGFNKRR